MDTKKTIIILGSSSGIGSKIIKYFPKNYEIYLFYGSKRPDNFYKHKMIKLNLNKISNLEKELKRVKIKNQRVVILNLASKKIDKLSNNVSIKNLKETFNINTFAFLKIIQHFLPTMIKNKWGRVINFSSTGGAEGEIGTLLYSSSKNATHSMIKVMSKEFAQFNITLNTINLGNFNTGLYKRLDLKIRNKIVEKIPSKKTGDFKDIYNAINFLIQTPYANGSVVNVDGGYAAK